MTDKENGRETPRKAKKSETLEVRLPYETKQAFLTACREDGTTASDVVRGSIDTYLDERERPTPQPETGTVLAMIPKPLRRPRLAIGLAAAAAGAALVVLPSAADPDIRAMFQRFDTNRDNLITPDEFMKTQSSGDQQRNVVVETRIERHGDDSGPPPGAQPKTEMKQDAYAFWLPDEAGGGAGAEVQHRYQVMSHKEIRIEGGDGAGPGGAVRREVTVSADDIRKQEFEAIDTDRDGKIMLSEFETRQKAMLTRGFEMLDFDKNGTLDEAEYLKIGSPPLPDLGHGPGDIEIKLPKGGPSVEGLKAAFVKLDRNGDRRLSLQEYLPQS